MAVPQNPPSEPDQPIRYRRCGTALPQCQPRYDPPGDEPLAGERAAGDAGKRARRQVDAKKLKVGIPH